MTCLPGRPGGIVAVVDLPGPRCVDVGHLPDRGSWLHDHGARGHRIVFQQRNADRETEEAGESDGRVRPDRFEVAAHAFGTHVDAEDDLRLRRLRRVVRNRRLGQEAEQMVAVPQFERLLPDGQPFDRRGRLRRDEDSFVGSDDPWFEHEILQCEPNRQVPHQVVTVPGARQRRCPARESPVRGAEVVAQHDFRNLPPCDEFTQRLRTVLRKVPDPSTSLPSGESTQSGIMGCERTPGAVQAEVAVRKLPHRLTFVEECGAPLRENGIHLGGQMGPPFSVDPLGQGLHDRDSVTIRDGADQRSGILSDGRDHHRVRRIVHHRCVPLCGVAQVHVRDPPC